MADGNSGADRLVPQLPHLDPTRQTAVESIDFFETTKALHLMGTTGNQDVYYLLSLEKSLSNGRGSTAASTSLSRSSSITDETIRPAPRLTYSTAVYSSKEAAAVMARLEQSSGDEVLLRAGTACVLLGCVRFTRGYYALLATSRRHAGRLGPHAILEVTETLLISLMAGDGSVGREGRLGSAATALMAAAAPYLLPRRSAEETYRSHFPLHELSSNFYYCTTYDITNTVQTNTAPVAGAREERMKYVWNEYLLEPLCAPLQETSEQDEGRPQFVGHAAAPAAAPLVRPWLVHLVRGAVTQRMVRVGPDQREVCVTVIGRVSKEYAGARFLRRGVCSTGAVANHVEVEQVVWDPASLLSGPTHGVLSSYVQLRGTVPVHWSHTPSSLPKPPIVLGLNDPYWSDTRLHFQSLLADYGHPIIVTSYLKTQEKHSRETLLGRAYRDAVCALTAAVGLPRGGAPNAEERSPAPHCSSTLSSLSSSASDILRYREVDLRRLSDRAWNVVTAAAEEDLLAVGFYVASADAHSPPQRLQKGVVRSNCIDCIDRTNIGQFMCGLQAMSHQLAALGVIPGPFALASAYDVHEHLLEMYLILGDAIAVQYGGSAQVGAGVLHRGTGWDQIMGMKRLYHNVLGDKTKQFALNLLLGRFQPAPGWPIVSRALNPEMAPPPPPQHLRADAEWSPGASLVLNVRGTAAPRHRGRPSSGPAQSLLERFSFTATSATVDERHATPGTGAGEAQSDYYLQVRKAPCLPDPCELQRWWCEPLAWYDKRHAVVPRGGEGGSITDTRASSPSSSFRTVQTEARRGNSCCARGGPADSSSVSAQPLPLQLLAHRFGAAFVREVVEPCRGLALAAVAAPCALDPFPMEELEHNYHTYPGEVRRSVYWANHARVECLCDAVGRECAAQVCEAGAEDDALLTEEMVAAQLYVLSSLGDPRHWDPSTVADALRLCSLGEGMILSEAPPSRITQVKNMLLEAGVDGSTLLAERSSSLVEEPWRGDGAVRRLASVARRLPHQTNAHEAAAAADEGGLCWMENGDDARSGGRGSSDVCWVTCRLLQEFFQTPLNSITLPQALDRVISRACHPRCGVPRYDCMRFTEQRGSGGASGWRVPAPVPLRGCFSARVLLEWLLRNSSECELTFHQHPQPRDRAMVAWRFIAWAISAAIIIPVAAMRDSKATTLQLLVDKTALFYLTACLEPRVLVTGPDAAAGRPYMAVSGIALTGSGISSRAENSCRMAFAALENAWRVLTEGQSAHITVELSALTNRLTDRLAEMALVDFHHIVAESNANDGGGFDALGIFINIYNTMCVHAWLSAMLWHHQHPGHPPQSAVVLYEASLYMLGKHRLSLGAMRDGILRGNRAPVYTCLPPFTQGDPRMDLIPAALRETCDEGSTTDCAALSEALMCSVFQHRSHILPEAAATQDVGDDGAIGNPRLTSERAIRHAMAVWREDTRYLGQRVALSLLDTHVAPPQQCHAAAAPYTSAVIPTIASAEAPDVGEYYVAEDGGLEENQTPIDPLSMSFFRMRQQTHSGPASNATTTDLWAAPHKHTSSHARDAQRHPCVPLLAGNVMPQLRQLEMDFLLSISTAAAATRARKLGPLLPYMDCFGPTEDNALQRLHDGYMSGVAVSKAHAALAAHRYD